MVDVAWKNGMVIFAMNVPSALVRLMMSLFPFALAPETCVPLPAFTACAPTMFVPFGSVMKVAPGEARALSATRSIAYWKFFTVTGLPSLNLNPFRIVNV